MTNEVREETYSREAHSLWAILLTKFECKHKTSPNACAIIAISFEKEAGKHNRGLSVLNGSPALSEFNIEDWTIRREVKG